MRVVLILTTAIVLAGYRVWRLRARGPAVWSALGLTLDRSSAVDALAGAIVATLSLSAIFVLEWWTGMLTVQKLGPAANLSTDWITPVVVGFTEEFVFRCAILGALLLCTSVPVAIALSAAVFAVGHLKNQHVNIVAIVCYFVGGVVYGAAFVKTSRVWLAFGLHMGWNYAEGRILGFAVSGGMVWGPFIQQHDNGPAFWTGGSYGPEGGMLGLLAKIIILALLFGWLRLRGGGAAQQGVSGLLPSREKRSC
jgi:membrane protease YdiL (CAAX protease family)